jgi:hypothetical protein
MQQISPTKVVIRGLPIKMWLDWHKKCAVQITAPARVQPDQNVNWNVFPQPESNREQAEAESKSPERRFSVAHPDQIYPATDASVLCGSHFPNY